MILYAKFGEHQLLNRQSASYAREGITSTLVDWVGAWGHQNVQGEPTSLLHMVGTHLRYYNHLR